MEKRGNQQWKQRWRAWQVRRRRAAAVRAERLRTLGFIGYSRQAAAKTFRGWRTRLRTPQARAQTKVALFGFIMGLGLVIWQAGLLPAGNAYRLFARSNEGTEEHIPAENRGLHEAALERFAALGAGHLDAYHLTDLGAVSAASGQGNSPEDKEEAELVAAFASLPAVVDFSEMVWPITGDVSRSFGWYRDPATQEWVFHSALQLQPGRDHAAVRASLAGVVEAVDVAGSGYQVQIRHSQGWSSHYAGLSDVTVKTGSVVAAGDTIGEIGIMDDQTSLGFGLYRDGEAVDPQGYLYSPS